MSFFVTLFRLDVEIPFVNSSINLNNILLNSNLFISCSSSGNPTPVVNWYKGSTIISNSGNLYLTRITEDNNGCYNCKATTGNLVKETSIDLKINCKSIVVLNCKSIATLR